MADDSPRSDKPSYSLDLSTGKPPRRRKRKGPPPVVQQTINLSTPKPEPDPGTKAQATPASGPTGKGGNGMAKGTPKRDRKRTPTASGTSLADLLDPDTLARLRGDD